MKPTNSVLSWGQRAGAIFDRVISRLSYYSAGAPTLTRTQQSWPGTNPNSVYSQIQRNNMQWNADYIVKNVAFAIGYLKIRRNYCSPQGWSPNTGDKQLNLDVKAYCDEQWKDMGVNCSMWTAFSRTADVELPTRGDSALIWYRDESRLKLMEVSSDQIGELLFYNNPVTKIDGLTYFAGMYFDKYGQRQAMKVYQRGWADNYVDPVVYPASDVIYFQDNLVRGVRGVTSFHGAIESITKAGKLWQYGMDAAQKQAKTAVVMSNEYGQPTGPQYGYSEETSADGGVVIIERNFDGAETQFQYNGDGYDLIQTTAPGPELINGCRYADEQASLSLAMPYAFLVNAASEGGATYRGELGKAGKEINRITRLHEEQFKKIVYVTIMEGINNRVFSGKALNFDMTGGTVDFPTLPTADSFRESKDDIMSNRAGIESKKRILGRYRESWDVVLNENKQEAIDVSMAVQDANKELIAAGYKGDVTAADISQNSDNPQQSAAAEDMTLSPKTSKSLSDNSAPARLSEMVSECEDCEGCEYCDESMARMEDDSEKRFEKVVTDPETGRERTIKYGQAGKAADGGDRIRPGTAKGDSYCARSAKIKGDWKDDPNSPNNLSRKKWKCRGSKSMATLAFDESKHERADDGKWTSGSSSAHIDKSETGKANSSPAFRFGKGSGDLEFHSLNKDYSEAYAEEKGADKSHVQATKVDLKNPLVVNASDRGFADPSYEVPFIKHAKKNGHDGVIFKNGEDKFFVKFNNPVTAALAEFDESKHPRASDGKFGSGKAELVLQKLGVKEINLPNNLDLKQMAVEAVTLVKDKGYSVPEVITSKNFESRAVAYASGNSISLTRGRISAEQFDKSVASGFLSQRNPVLHEIAHLQHEKSDRNYDLKSTWAFQTHKQIAGKVSRYAMTNPKEFVAETFSGYLSGKRYPDEVMNLYKLQNGPELK
jgi:hypothetical protein